MINEFTPTQVRNDFEEIKEGCVGIQILKDVSVTLTDMIQTDTVGSIQSLLNRPKAIFIGSLLLEILDMNFNLDLAVVASSQAGEDTIVNVLSSFDSIEFVRIKEIYQSEAPTLFGVLVALRKNERLKISPFKLKTDVIIFLDSYLVTNKKEIVSLFNGVIHKHPQVLSIICLRTPDLSVSNYKEKYPHSHINLNTMVTALPPHEADLFQELVYPEMNNCNRRYYNTLVKERLAGWMQLKDKTLYEPCLLPFKSLPLKSPNPWNLSSDQGTPTESEDSIVEGLKTLEHAWDKAYDELYRTIYGDD